MNPNTEILRKKYMDHPPEGMTSEDIRRMSEDGLLDMDYFLHEDDLAVSSYCYALTRACLTYVR